MVGERRGSAFGQLLVFQRMSFLGRTMCIAARFSSNEKKSGLSFFIFSSFFSAIVYYFFFRFIFLPSFLSRDESTTLRGIRFHVPGSLLALSWGQLYTLRTCECWTTL